MHFLALHECAPPQKRISIGSSVSAGLSGAPNTKNKRAAGNKPNLYRASDVARCNRKKKENKKNRDGFANAESCSTPLWDRRPALFTFYLVQFLLFMRAKTEKNWENI